MAALVPDDLATEGVPSGDGPGPGLRRADAEIPLPVLRFTIVQSMGEVEVVRH
jgi:hypothetical protein